MKRAAENHSLTLSDSRRACRPALCATRSVSVIEGQALWAGTYDLTPNPLLALEERTLDILLPGLHYKFVIDVACGTGRWLLKFKAHGVRRSLGVDLSAEMLAQASRKPLLNGSLIRGHACALPIRRATADLVMSSFSVGYIEDLRAFAGELARVLRPYGLVVVSDFHPENRSRRWRRTFRLGSEVYEIRSFARPTAQICAEFGKCGLTLETIIEPCFGEPERHLFEAHGKGQIFENSRSKPAIFVCFFRRIPKTLPSENAG
jgi:malonyl-CoA O-methyltransferase